MNRLSPYLLGTIIMISGVLILSPDSGMLRLINGDPYVVSFWRGVGTCFVMWTLALIHSPSHFVAQLSRPSWLALGIVLAFGLSSIAFVMGVAYLGAATMLIFVAMTPFASAITSRVLFREHTDRVLWFAIIAGLVGASIAGSAVPVDTPIEGLIAAALVPCMTGVGISMTRHFPADTIWPLYGLACGLSAFVLFFFLSTVSVPPGTEWFVGLNACVIVPFSFAFITIAPKYLPAPEVGLYLLLETLIGPLIVWFLVDEAPRTADYIGGVIILAALTSLFIHRMCAAAKLQIS